MSAQCACVFHIHSIKVLCEYFLKIHKIYILFWIPSWSLWGTNCNVFVRNISLHRRSPVIPTYAPSFWYYYYQTGKDKRDKYVYVKQRSAIWGKRGALHITVYSRQFSVRVSRSWEHQEAVRILFWFFKWKKQNNYYEKWYKMCLVIAETHNMLHLYRFRPSFFNRH
jgi:hypothetical protein